MKPSKLNAVIAAIIKLRDSATDEESFTVVDIYPEWKPNTLYKSGSKRYLYDGNLYRCEQTHTSQVGWEPPAVPALWTRVSDEHWPEWVQPTGAQDAYDFGAKVAHNEKHWVSNLSGKNTWEPGVYGWDEVTE